MAEDDNTSDSLRKSPRQSRSVALVDAIMDATVRILPKSGWRGITTKKVAEVAGVSIGSLYQYFPNKEALLNAVISFAMKSQHERFEQHINEQSKLSTEDAINSIIDLALNLFIDDLPKMRVLYRAAPELGMIKAIVDLRRRTAERLALELRARYPKVSERKAQVITFVMVNAVMGVMQEMIYDDEADFSREELGAELKKMLASFLVRVEC